MERGRRRGWILAVMLGAVLLGTGWFLFAPQVFGGPTAYVVASGSSMRPGIDGGDLVLLRSADSYRVGDVVAYRSPTLDIVVLHRIVGVDAGRFTFQGDANTWVDPDRLPAGDLLGRVWVRVPGAGAALGRPPVRFALIAVLLLGAFGGLAGGARRRRSSTRPARRTASPAWSAGVAAASIGFVALVALGGLAFSAPLVRTTTTPAPFAQSGTFAYSAEVPAGAVYEGGVIATGDPVYLRLADELDITFAYSFHADAPHQVTGSGRLFAVVSDADGWSRRIALGPEAALSGDSVTLAGRLDLVAIRATLTRVARLTGVVRDRYLLEIVPDVRAVVTGAGGDRQVTFAPSLPFQIDALELQLSAGASAPGEEGTALHPTAEGSLDRTVQRPNTVSILGRRVGVRRAGQMAVAGSIACLGALLALIVVGHRRRTEDEPSLIRRRYGRLLVPVGGRLAPAIHQVEVADMEALVRIAEHYDCLILEGGTDVARDFAVEHGGVRYRYRAGSGRGTAGVGANGHGTKGDLVPANGNGSAVAP